MDVKRATATWEGGSEECYIVFDESEKMVDILDHSDLCYAISLFKDIG